MATRTTTKVSEISGYQLSLAVRDARKRLREVRTEEETLRDKKERLQKEVTELTEAHEQIYKRYQEVKSKANLKIIQASQRCEREDIFDDLLELVQHRNREDDIIAENLNEQLQLLRQECAKAAENLHRQREKTMWTLDKMSVEKDRLELDTNKHAKVIQHLIDERGSLEARTNRSILDLAQSLFGMKSSTGSNW